MLGLAHPFRCLDRRNEEALERLAPVFQHPKPADSAAERLIMKTIMVRYKTSEAHASTNEALVRAVFDELRSRAPSGLRYATYRLRDGVTFVHLATMETPDENPLTVLPAFKAFQQQLKERCVEAPLVTELCAVDAYSGLVA
jgi:hypothetical protein